MVACFAFHLGLSLHSSVCPQTDSKVFEDLKSKQPSGSIPEWHGDGDCVRSVLCTRQCAESGGLCKACSHLSKQQRYRTLEAQAQAAGKRISELQNAWQGWQQGDGTTAEDVAELLRHAPDPELVSREEALLQARAATMVLCDLQKANRELSKQLARDGAQLASLREQVAAQTARCHTLQELQDVVQSAERAGELGQGMDLSEPACWCWTCCRSIFVCAWQRAGLVDGLMALRHHSVLSMLACMSGPIL